MSHWMKRSLAALGACALLLTGCNDAQQETDKNTDSEPVEITENDVYLVPDDPTAYMKTAYDEVSSALNEADRGSRQAVHRGLLHAVEQDGGYGCRRAGVHCLSVI